LPHAMARMQCGNQRAAESVGAPGSCVSRRVAPRKRWIAAAMHNLI
jgi:hypothetical protein